MKTHIIIVGGGASCIAFIDALLRNKHLEKLNKVSITILEKTEETGPGNAYFDDLTSNILNTKAGYITVFKDYPGDFFNWINYRKYKWKRRFPELEINHDTYVPRALFGMYMQDAFSYVCARACHSGMDVKVIHDEVISIENTTVDRVRVTTRKGFMVEGNKVILACGTQQRSQTPLPYSKDIIPSPYPTKDLIRKVSVDEKIAIIGARLSAIDCIIALVEAGHRGGITIYSRSGYFPFVRGTQGRYKNAYLNANYIADNHSTLNFIGLSVLYTKEQKRYQRLTDNDFFEELPLLKKPINCLEQFLVKELHLAKYNRGWQAILYDTNAAIDKIWNRLKPEEQDVFMGKYFSYAASLRVSIPPENAKKILSYLRTGQLTFITGNISIDLTNETIQICCDNSCIVVDKIIYATGSPKSLNDMDSPLIRNLVESGLAVENKFGGLDVCKINYGLFDKNTQMSTNIFAIGELTSGCFLFTSAMDIIVRHAHACADSMVTLHTVKGSHCKSLISAEC